MGRIVLTFKLISFLKRFSSSFVFYIFYLSKLPYHANNTYLTRFTLPLTSSSSRINIFFEIDLKNERSNIYCIFFVSDRDLVDHPSDTRRPMRLTMRRRILARIACLRIVATMFRQIKHRRDRRHRRVSPRSLRVVLVLICPCQHRRFLYRRNRSAHQCRRFHHRRRLVPRRLHEAARQSRSTHPPATFLPTMVSNRPTMASNRSTFTQKVTKNCSNR